MARERSLGYTSPESGRVEGRDTTTVCGAGEQERPGRIGARVVEVTLGDARIAQRSRRPLKRADQRGPERVDDTGRAVVEDMLLRPVGVLTVVDLSLIHI